MPIETDDRLKALLAQGHITAVTLDTNVFDGLRLNFRSPALRTIVNLRGLSFSFLLSSTVVREVQGHAEKAMEVALRAVKKAVGEALFAFDTTKPTRDELLDQIVDGHNPKNAASVRVDEFVKESGCEVLDDTSLVDVATVFGAYFDRLPPFSHGKKAEFPDALALQALDRVATDRRTGLLVVSEDGDWRAFCEQSQRLYLVTKVEKALSLINDAPLGLRKAIVAWLSDSHDGQAEIGSAVSNYVEGLDVDATANASSGEVEMHAWAAELRSIKWPVEADIDILSTETIEGGKLRAVVSLPVVLELRFGIELSFSVWDSIDKESVSMGGRTVEVDRDEDARVTVTIDLREIGEEDEEIELVETELDITSFDVELGEVDVFEPEDCDE